MRTVAPTPRQAVQVHSSLMAVRTPSSLGARCAATMSRTRAVSGCSAAGGRCAGAAASEPLALGCECVILVVWQS